MKTLLLALAAIIVSGCLATQPIDSIESLDLQNQSSVTLTVHGLSCPLCSNNLDGQLRRIDGVNDAQIDLKTGAVTIALAPGHNVTPEDLQNAVINAGFTLKAINTPAEP